MSKAAPALEFSRPLRVDRVPRKGSHEHLVAEPLECVSLAKRFAIPKVESFSARLLCVPWRGGGLKITGTVEARLLRDSVVSLEAFEATVQFEVERYFLPKEALNDADKEEADPIEEGIIDLGELAAETLGLDLDPYPRKAGEKFTA